MELFPLIRQGKSDQVAALLDQQKLNPNVHNEKGQTPLYWACEIKSPAAVELARLLIQYGADVNAPEDHGFTPLHLAAYIGNADVVRLLLESGAAVNQSNRSHSTPLHLAARNGHAAVVSQLILHGADVRAKDNRLKIPLAYATNPQISKLLQGWTHCPILSQPPFRMAPDVLVRCGAVADACADAMLAEKNQVPSWLASTLSRENSSQSDDEVRKKKGRKGEKALRSSKQKAQKERKAEIGDVELERLSSLVNSLSGRLAREAQIAESLKQERDDERRRATCKRCRKARCDTVLVPCMHLSFCWDCCGRMGMKCQKCGVAIEGMMRVVI